MKVEAVAQIQIMSDDVGVGTASRAFLALIEGKRMQEAELSILQTVNKTLEGHIRMICSTLTVEEINSDREAFARKVQEVAETDLNKMGVHLVSLVVKNITDERNYLVDQPLLGGRRRVAARPGDRLVPLVRDLGLDLRPDRLPLTVDAAIEAMDDLELAACEMRRDRDVPLACLL